MARGAKKGTNRFEAFQEERRSLIMEGLGAAFIIAKKSTLKFDSVTSISNYAASIINNRGQVHVSAATLRKNAHYRAQLEDFISKNDHISSISQGIQRVKHELEISQLKERIKTLENFISQNLRPQLTPKALAVDSGETLATMKLCQLIDRLLAASEDILALEGAQIIRPYAISKAMRVVVDQNLVSIYLQNRTTNENSQAE